MAPVLITRATQRIPQNATMHGLTLYPCLHGAQALITNKVPDFRALLQQLTDLCYVGVTATGYNIIDLEACNEFGVTVTNVPEYSTEAVVQAMWAHLLNLTALHAKSVRNGDWISNPDFCYWKTPLPALNSLTHGKIGGATAAIARAFGMRILATTRTSKQADGP